MPEVQLNLYHFLIFIGFIFIIVFLFLSYSFYQVMQQIKSTARTIEKTIEENEELFENLKKITSQLNEQLTELNPIILQLKDTMNKIKTLKENIFNLLLFLLGFVKSPLGKLPSFISGFRWILKKFKKS